MNHCDDINRLFVDRIKARKQELGLTMPEIAERSGIPKPTLETYFSGKSLPNVLRFARLADVLDCTPDYLSGCCDELERAHGQHTPVSLKAAYGRVIEDLSTYQAEQAAQGHFELALILSETKGHLRSMAARRT